ncbi:MAG: hypothetical protein CM15mP29_4230 [Alphaproteobacteria bacterium]|nr:MAG: hypothetical protein CM15mP29_4230 [Alphaproteobacteria bacterium]
MQVCFSPKTRGKGNFWEKKIHRKYKKDSGKFRKNKILIGDLLLFWESETKNLEILRDKIVDIFS